MFNTWSSEGHTYTSKQLFKWLLEIVIPMANYQDIPSEPPLNMPSLPEMVELGTVSGLAKDLEQENKDNKEAMKSKAARIKGERGDMGFGDKWSDQQMSVLPEFNEENMLGFKVEMVWSYAGGDGGQCFG